MIRTPKYMMTVHWMLRVEVQGANTLSLYMGGCQNYGPFLGTLNIRGRIIIGTQKGTIILTTTHIDIYIYKIPDYAETCHVASTNNLEPHRKMGPEPLCMLWQGQLIFQAQNVSARV